VPWAKKTAFVGVLLVLASTALAGGSAYLAFHPPVGLVAHENVSPVVPLPNAHQSPSVAPTAPPSDENAEEASPPKPKTVETPELSIPAVGLHAPLEALAVQGGEITPPSFDTAYIVTDFSVPTATPEEGAVFVVFHSLRNGAGLGNTLFDQQTQAPTLGAGESINVAGTSYNVVSTEEVLKDDLPARSDIWEAGPNQLYLVTCLQNADGSPSTRNFVVHAIR
jgi:hypothetical protein